MSSSATDAYVALNELHPAAAVSRPPGPGPLLSWAEWTSGGKAIHTGAVIPATPYRSGRAERPPGLMGGVTSPQQVVVSGRAKVPAAGLSGGT